MITCKHVATLIGMDQLAGEPWWKHLRARLHLTMCEHCRRFDRQLQQIGADVKLIQAAIDREPAAGRIEQKIALRLGLTSDHLPPQK